MTFPIRLLAVPTIVAAVFSGPAAVRAQGPAGGQSASAFRFTEKPGPHPVGLRVVHQFDHARTYRPRVDALGNPEKRERARPLQTLVWYPATPGTSRRMTVGDYASLQSTEVDFERPSVHAGQRWFLQGIEPNSGQPLWAVRDAKPADGQFPLVIYAPSFEAMSWENADLCEYLASHGYVVVASPSLGANDRSMTDDLAGVNAQAQDISFLIGWARTLPGVDASAIAVGGFSWGGLSNLLAAVRDDRITALFDLDGSIRYRPGLVKEMGGHPEEMMLPLLFFTQGQVTLEDLGPRMTDGPNVLNAWTHGDLVTVQMVGMTHVDFASMYLRNQELGERLLEGPFRAAFGFEDAVAGYGWMSRYTLRFLDAYLKKDAGAVAFFRRTPAENGVPPHVMVAKFRAAKAAPATMDTFRAEVGRQGFDKASSVLESMRKQDPEFKPDEEKLNAWGYALLSEDRPAEGIAVLKFAVYLYPKSASALQDLGEAFLLIGDRKLALETFRKVLELRPDHPRARQRVRQLGGRGKGGPLAS